ncbi:MAG TPA: FHA domain-containing protein [Kofleriaceae bacterium]|jgi:hypothetical protein
MTRKPAPVAELLPEHVAALPSDETDAALVDAFERAHPLRALAVVGRDPSSPVAVLHKSVSRRHAELRYDVDADAWTVADLGSRNGTTVDGAPVRAPCPLPDGALVVFGDVGFVFVADRAQLPAAGPHAYGATAESTRKIGELRLSSPTTEGAGLVGHGDAQIALGALQFALLHRLAERFVADPEDLRGFVRSVELLADLPWNTPNPEDNHLKQQVRRVRRALEKLGLANAIESRHGFGYRLRTPPVFE